MAIRLEVEPYCENCMIFEPDVESPKRACCLDSTVIQTDTIIYCSKRNTCAGIKRYLEKETRDKYYNSNI